MTYIITFFCQSYVPELMSKFLNHRKSSSDTHIDIKSSQLCDVLFVDSRFTQSDCNRLLIIIITPYNPNKSTVNPL